MSHTSLMNDYLLMHSSELFSYSLMVTFVFLMVWEVMLPWVKPTASIPVRWWNNIALHALNSYFFLLIIPVTTISAAIYSQEHILGLLHALDFNLWSSFVIGFFLYDFFHYSIHRVFHKIPVLWKLHRLHHSDPDVDVSTELKHHPFEVVMTVGAAVVVVFLFGIPPVAIILCSLLTQVVSLISHANIKISENVDTLTRKVFVTPSMHRIHHSAWQPETDSNYGVLFSFWDRLFGTYVDMPLAGYESMTLGLDIFRSPRDLWLDKLLLQPFRRHLIVPTSNGELIDERKTPIRSCASKDLD